MARFVGGLAIMAGIVAGLVFYFVLPISDSFVGSLGMLFAFVTFCVGVGILLYGLLAGRSKSKV
jgi:hypothetical protein